MELKGIEGRSPLGALDRMAGLIWGPSGAGKTTLAATAPRPMLWLNFDSDGDASIAGQDGITVFDFSDQPDKIVETFKVEDPLGLSKVLEENPDIQTVVFDSLTSFTEKALQHGVKHAANTAQHKSATLEDPGYGGYGRRNTWTHLAVKNILWVTKKYKRNIIFIAHENTGDKNEKGTITGYSIMLGGDMAKSIAIKLSEVWFMDEVNNKRRITVKPARLRSPVKTRMFSTVGDADFFWTFDPESWEPKEMTIEHWIKRWQDAGGKKIDKP